MIKDAIAKVARGQDLTEEEMRASMDEILTGLATSAQIGSLITALRVKGETVDEITGAAKAMRRRATKIRLNNHLVHPVKKASGTSLSPGYDQSGESTVPTSVPAPFNRVNIDRDEINIEEETILDTCGTGGDGTHTFNVSTATAFVVAGGGIKVAKHGQRAVSSHCGSADVLRALGLKLDINHANATRCMDELGIAFLYAPLFYGAMKYPALPRQEIGIRTIFNLLGPLTNPAGATAQVMGVYDPDLTTKMAQVLERLGTREAFVVHGEDTFDEISICGSTRISHLKEGKIDTFHITPEEYGFKRARPEEIEGGNARQNASIIREILEGERGPKRDMVLMNAAAAFVAAGLDEDFETGVERAGEAIDSGQAKQKLDDVISFTQKCGYLVRKEL
jgi:anthranilate phosphoribosyltransferase